jgi:peptide/nickel transport system substrate-binding protein
MKRQLMSVASLLVIASLLLAACGAGATATQAPVPTQAAQPTTQAGQPTNPPAPTVAVQPTTPPEPGKIKNVVGAWSQEPNNIVPYYTVMSYAIWIAQLTLVGLAEWDDKGEFVPELAAEVPTAENGGVSADGLTITWKLKPGLKWSDGEPLTSKDVKFTWESIMDPKNAPTSRSGYDKIASVETPDDLTVVIKFSELYPPWQGLFTQGPNNGGSILPSHLLAGKTALENDPFIHQPTVASGPFVISEWTSGDHMTLVQNPNFYGSKPKLDQVQIKFVANSDVALAGLKTGDID